MTEELWRLSAVEIAAGIRSQKFSAERVMASVTERIHDCNRDLNAIVYDYSEQAMCQARGADRALGAGEGIGPLHGVPVTIKSNIDVAGTPTPNGLPERRWQARQLQATANSGSPSVVTRSWPQAQVAQCSVSLMASFFLVRPQRRPWRRASRRHRR